MASAKPATEPVGSTAGVAVTAVTTPEVPIETTTSPSPAPRPSAAAALSPAPAPRTVPPMVAATSPGATTRGRCGTAPEGTLEQVGAVVTRRCRPVARAAGVAAVGRQVAQVGAPGQLPGEPVVRQAHRGRTTGVLGLVLGEPAQLGHGERRDGHDTDRLGPGATAHLGTAELVDEVAGGAGRTGVVPQQGGAYDGSVLVEADHAVLLAADADGCHVVQASGLGDRRLQRGPPVVRVHLGAVRMPGAALPHELARLGVADDDLAGLGGGVDAGYQPGPVSHGRGC